MARKMYRMTVQIYIAAKSQSCDFLSLFPQLFIFFHTIFKNMLANKQIYNFGPYTLKMSKHVTGENRDDLY